MPDEAPKTQSDPPSSKTKNFVARLNAYRNLILAVAALSTAVGSWFRPTDTTATKNSFGWTSKKIEELSSNEVKMHEDITALGGYLEGYVKGQQQEQASRDEVVTGHSSGGSGVRRSRKPKTANAAPAAQITIPMAVPPAAMVAPPIEAMAAPNMAVNEAAQQQKLPELQAKPLFVKRPKFEDVAYGTKK
jgi:hypothetical protein